MAPSLKIMFDKISKQTDRVSGTCVLEKRIRHRTQSLTSTRKQGIRFSKVHILFQLFGRPKNTAFCFQGIA